MTPGVFATALAVAVYGSAQLAKSENWPHASYWKPGTIWTIVLVLSGVLAIIGYFLVTFGYERALTRSNQNVEFGAFCRDIAVFVSNQAQIPYEKVGVHVWMVRGMRGMQYLERRAQFVPRRRPPSPVTWRRGKGAMGICWEENHPLVADVEALESQAPTEASFCALARRERFGLTWSEFSATKHYRAILALPLRAGPPEARKVKAVISVDVQVDGHAQTLDTLLSTQQFGYVLSMCEDVLRRK